MTTSTALTKSQSELAVGNRGVRLESLEDAFRFSEAVIKSGMAPKGYTQPVQVLVAIQRGAEVGLPPMQALDCIAVINGRPTLYGDGLPALVRSSGLLEWMKEDVSGTGDQRRASCTVKRRDDAEPCTRTFSMADAKRAGLVGKAGPWTQYPDRMLAMRARSWAFRDTFADVLRGLQVREEVMDHPDEPEPSRLVRLSELPDAVPITTVSAREPMPGPVASLPAADDGEPHGDSFERLRASIEATPATDQDGLNALYVDLDRARDEGQVTEDESFELRTLLGGKVPF